MPAGAKGKYREWLTEDGLLLLRAWARDGATDEILTEKMGIGVSTLHEWKNRFPEIAEALKKGKEPVDIEVENALLKRALGYTAEIKKTFKVKKVLVEKGIRREVEELAIGYDEIHVPADVTAQIYWLKNRKPKAWRDRQPDDTDNTSAINDGLIAIADLINNPRPNREMPKEPIKTIDE